MTFPNLVVAGAPKCGTSSLHRWLADHPDVCSPLRDESRYLLDSDSLLRSPHGRFAAGGLDGYAALFASCLPDPDGARQVLEVTPDYLYQDTAPRVLASLADRGGSSTKPPIAVFVLRRPANRVYSHYRFARNNMAILPRSVTFPTFVAAARRDDRKLFRGRRENLRNVLRYSRYADYLERWIEILGRDAVKVYLFEDLEAAPAAFMRRLARDTGIDPTFYAGYHFERVKESIEVRRQWLQRLRTGIGRELPAGRLKRQLRTWYDGANVGPGTPEISEADRSMLAELDAEFAADNRRLVTLTGLDLGAWQ